MPLDRRAILEELLPEAGLPVSEDACTESIVIPLLLRLGFEHHQLQRNVTIRDAHGKSLGAHAGLLVTIDDHPALVVEAKDLSHRLNDEDVNRALAYARLLRLRVPLVVLTNGRDWEVYQFGHASIGGLDQVPDATDLAARFHGASVPAPGGEERAAAERMLRTLTGKEALAAAFQRCRKLLNREGFLAESAFDELTKVTLCKFNEERRADAGLGSNRFTRASLLESGPLSALQSIFDDAKQPFRVFGTQAAIQIQRNETAQQLVEVLEPFAFHGFNTPLGLAGGGGDVIGSVYEAFLSGTLRGDLGQYLTPRQIVDLMVDIADLQIEDRVLDLACGSGGFLIRSYVELKKKIRSSGLSVDAQEHQLRRLVEDRLWGIEINPRLSTLCRINMMLHGGGYEHIYDGDSIRSDVFENADGRGIDLRAVERGEQPRFDVILMNPPFNLPYTDEQTLDRYAIGRGKAAQGSDYLMLERAINLLDPGRGRLLIILPHGVANGTAEQPIRDYIRHTCRVRACISLPVGCFKPFGGANARTCVLVLSRKQSTDGGARRFMAQVEHVGYDTSSKHYQRTGHDELPMVAQAYHALKGDL